MTVVNAVSVDADSIRSNGMANTESKIALKVVQREGRNTEGKNTGGLSATWCSRSDFAWQCDRNSVCWGKKLGYPQKTTILVDEACQRAAVC